MGSSDGAVPFVNLRAPSPSLNAKLLKIFVKFFYSPQYLQTHFSICSQYKVMLLIYTYLASTAISSYEVELHCTIVKGMVSKILF